jgi:hypothetical protein
LRERRIERLQARWGVGSYLLALPEQIRPTSELGDTSLESLNRIAAKVSLAIGRQLLLAQCSNDDGTFAMLGWKHIDTVVKGLTKKARGRPAKDPDVDD